MAEVGKKLRLGRVLSEDDKILIAAMDHGIGGPHPGLENMAETIRKVIKGGADAVMVNPGIARQFYQEIRRKASLVLSIPTDPRYVKLAVKIGADAVKNTYFGSLNDRERLSHIGELAVECLDWGMPFLAEIVPMDMETRKMLIEPQYVKAAARIGAEYGADLIKTCYTGTPETFKEVIEVCPIPITILGGTRMETDRQVLETVRGAIDAGSAGVAFGRNIWQHKNPTAMTRAIKMIIHENANVDEALKELKIYRVIQN